jgi:hypothetical protein
MLEFLDLNIFLAAFTVSSAVLSGVWWLSSTIAKLTAAVHELDLGAREEREERKQQAAGLEARLTQRMDRLSAQLPNSLH